ncbi:MAG: fibronectin type III domain-containing protein [Planctomycetes bacterium]|nr:fibronectin type III domain-containing protein [Planctomycetota bacterium]
MRGIFVPPAPTGLTATSGNAQVTLSWTAPTGVIAQAPITDYREQYSTDNGATWTTFSASASTATSATVTGLTNGTAYVFRVAAVNAVGVGAYTAASSSVTPAAFAPTSIAGLQLWADASDASTLYDATSGGSLVAADGGVARWQDKSGNSRHFTQATSGSRPLRKTGQQNGLATLRFDGTNDSMSIASSTATFKFAHDGDSTLFIVYKAGTTANPNTLYAIIGNGLNDGSLDFQTGFYLRWDDRGEVPYQDQSVYVVANNGSPRYVGVSAANTFPTNVFNLQTIVSNPQDSTIANRATIRKNGGSAVSVDTSGTNAGTALPTANATQDLRIGATSGTATWFLAGDIAEIIMYDSALSDANRALVESYLTSKWGLS